MVVSEARQVALQQCGATLPQCGRGWQRRAPTCLQVVAAVRGPAAVVKVGESDTSDVVRCVVHREAVHRLEQPIVAEQCGAVRVRGVSPEKNEDVPAHELGARGARKDPLIRSVAPHAAVQRGASSLSELSARLYRVEFHL